MPYELQAPHVHAELSEHKIHDYVFEVTASVQIPSEVSLNRVSSAQGSSPWLNFTAFCILWLKIKGMTISLKAKGRESTVM
jgi:hypothetical protein